jgi:hypothetical protein
MRPTAALAFLAAFAMAPAHATTLYKWVSSDGVVNFSDSPPEQGGAIVVGVTADEPKDRELPVARLDELSQSDESIARANTRVDLAEHALAVSRRPLWSPTDGLRLPRDEPPPADAQQKSQFYMGDVLKARRELLETLRRKNAQATR